MTADRLDIIRTASYDRNEARADMDQPCIRCGKGIKIDKPYITVHMSTDWQAVPVAEDLPADKDQGWWAVGSECAKHIPARFRQAAR